MTRPHFPFVSLPSRQPRSGKPRSCAIHRPLSARTDDPRQLRPSAGNEVKHGLESISPARRGRAGPGRPDRRRTPAAPTPHRPAHQRAGQHWRLPVRADDPGRARPGRRRFTDRRLCSLRDRLPRRRRDHARRPQRARPEHRSHPLVHRRHRRPVQHGPAAGGHARQPGGALRQHPVARHRPTPEPPGRVAGQRGRATLRSADRLPRRGRDPGSQPDAAQPRQQRPAPAIAAQRGSGQPGQAGSPRRTARHPPKLRRSWNAWSAGSAWRRASARCAGRSSNWRPTERRPPQHNRLPGPQGSGGSSANGAAAL